MPSDVTPEEIVGASRSPQIDLSLRCTRCHQTSKQSFDWACVHPKLAACRTDGWDGISLSRVFRCPTCGAVDDYELAGDSYLRLTGGLTRFLTRSRDERVMIGEPRLWDGTVVRRPSQALARLRELAREHAGLAEAHRRLGNGCERFGVIEEAEAAWRRALDIDEHDAESAASLAGILLVSPTTAADGFSFLQRALAALPKAKYPDSEARRNAACGVLDVVRKLAEAGEPLALMAAWPSGKVKNRHVASVSSVDIRSVLDVWDRVVDFAASPDVYGLTLTPELPKDESTILERLLVDGPDPMPDAPLPSGEPVRVAPRLGRNDPCWCGSSKKYKRCHLGSDGNATISDSRS